LTQNDHPRLQTAAPLAVVMIALNEAHNMKEVLDNLAGFAAEIFLVDSYSSDDTVQLALARGVGVVQRKFRGFGNQWNFALETLPVTQTWTMKLDPDERLSDELKQSIRMALARDAADGFVLPRRLWFMGTPLPIRQDILRIWRTGTCRFEDVLVNEHPIVPGRHDLLRGDLEHHDSPTLHHWYDKQNAYTTAEAIGAWRNDSLSAQPRLFGSIIERRMWIKALTRRMPFVPVLFFFYCLIGRGAWRAGRTGVIWARLRADVYRMIAYKRREIRRLGAAYEIPRPLTGAPDPRIPQYD
jgi:glycosyltransferase involved in cell wall biosynthesis